MRLEVGRYQRRLNFQFPFLYSIIDVAVDIDYCTITSAKVNVYYSD